MTGVRIDCAGRKSDVIRNEQKLLIRKAIYKGGLKPDAKDVVFPLYPELSVLCEELLAMDHRRGDYLLPIRDFRQSVKSACLKLGLPHLAPHDFRHLFGTTMLNPENAQVLSPADVAYLMCHKRGPKVLLDRYAHVSPRLEKRQRASRSSGNPQLRASPPQPLPLQPLPRRTNRPANPPLRAEHFRRIPNQLIPIDAVHGAWRDQAVALTCARNVEYPMQQSLAASFMGNRPGARRLRYLNRLPCPIIGR